MCRDSVRWLRIADNARIPRKTTVIWNVVPWYIGSGQKIRAADRGDLAAGLAHLQQLLQLLLALRIVVIIRQKPTFAEKYIAASRPGVEIVGAPHPSPLYVNHLPANREKILGVLRGVARNLQPGARDAG
jgi:uracil-DNA glycosylase